MKADSREQPKNKNLSFKEMAKNIDKNCSTISRKMRSEYVVKNTSRIEMSFHIKYTEIIAEIEVVNPKNKNTT